MAQVLHPWQILLAGLGHKVARTTLAANDFFTVEAKAAGRILARIEEEGFRIVGCVWRT